MIPAGVTLRMRLFSRVADVQVSRSVEGDAVQEVQLGGGRLAAVTRETCCAGPGDRRDDSVGLTLRTRLLNLSAM